MSLAIDIQTILKKNTYNKIIYLDIYKIFEKHQEKTSSNSDGVMINLNTCKNETLMEISEYLTLIDKNKENHDQYIDFTEKVIKKFENQINAKPSQKTTLSIPKKFSKTVRGNPIPYNDFEKRVVYKGVYKRIYDCIRGNKKPTSNAVLDTQEGPYRVEVQDEDIEPEDDVVDDCPELGDNVVEDDTENIEDDTEIVGSDNEDLFGSDED